ncbi:hypothetical protein [Promicromonospora sp. NFX87]|uniref:hypothetical protein n=1 Tax=Promicromonospora sp. NFX87 TaxID=3402691 RepID=UPI003AFA5E23
MALVVAELMTLFKGDDSGVETVIKRTENRRKEIDGATATVKVDGDDTAALRSFDEVLAGLREIDSSTARATVQADIDTAQAALRDLAAELDDVDQTRAEAEVHAEVKRALSDLEKAERALEDLDSTVVRPRINPDGLHEFRDEANSTAREAAASFDGSFESAADAVQETAANALAGFGPIGAAAGLAAAAGLGIVLAKLNEISEATNAAAEEGAEWSTSFNGTDQAGRLGSLRDAWSELAAEVRDTREVYELWQDRAVTAVEQIAAASSLAGEDVSAFMSSFEETDPTTRLESLRDTLESVRAKQQEYIEAQQGFVTISESRALGDKRVALEQLGDIVEEEAAKQEAANEIERANASALGLSVDAYRAHIAAQERAAEAQDAYNQALTSAADPVSVYNDLLTQKEAAEQRTAEATAEATSDASDSWEDFAKDVTVTTGDLINQWQRQAREAQEFEENLAAIAAAGGQAMADELRAKGPEVAGSVAAVIAEAGPKQQAAAIASHAAATGSSISQQMADTLVKQGWRLQRAVDGTIEAVHPKKDITVTVTDGGSADRVKGEIADIPTSKVVTITTIQQVWGGSPTGTGTVLRNSATGSRLPGFPTGGRLPGRPPSDPLADNLLGVDGAGIPRVRVRSREWLIREPAADYYGDGLLSAINAMAVPREVLAGLPGLAGGGVQAARADVLRTQRALELARRSFRRVRSDRNEDRWSAAQEAAEAARERYARLREEAASLRTDLRRGDIRDQVTSGLSGAQGATDQLRDLARSGDLSRSSSERLAGGADKAERALSILYKHADRLDKKVASATSNFEKWKAIADDVSATISEGFSLGGVTGGTDPWSGAERAATGSQLLAATQSYEAKAKTLVLRLQALRKAGYGTAILQEVAAQGVEGGVAMADALLALSPKDMKALQSSLSEIDRLGDRAGAEATGGNLSSAARALEIAEAQAAAIDKRINDWATRLGSELARALGIKARAGGGPTVDGSAYLVGENGPELRVERSDGYIVNNPDTANVLRGGGPTVTHNWNITQYSPVNEPPSVTIAKTARQFANVGRR